MDSLMNSKPPLLKEGEQHRPFLDRLSDLSPVYNRIDALSAAEEEEERAIDELKQALYGEL